MASSSAVTGKAVFTSSTEMSLSMDSQQQPSDMCAWVSSCEKNVRARFFGLSSCTIAPFLLIILIEAFVISAYTICKTTGSIHSSWITAQNSSIHYINGMLSVESERMYNMGVTMGALYSNQSMTFGDATLMEVMCALLDNYDVNDMFRATILGSITSNEVALCTHGDTTAPSMRQLAGGYSVDHTLEAIYVVSPDNYAFKKPLEMWEQGVNTNVSNLIESRTDNILFETFDQFLRGEIDAIPSYMYWLQRENILNIILFTYPIITNEHPERVGMGGISKGQGYVDVRMDGKQICSLMGSVAHVDVRFMVITTSNTSLNNNGGEAVVLCNNWGQPPVNDSSAWSSTFTYKPVEYLHVREVSDPIMFEAIGAMYVAGVGSDSNLVTLVEGTNTARIHVEFSYNGAPVLASAWRHTSHYGLSTVMVLVTPLATVTGPYITTIHIFLVVVFMSCPLVSLLVWLVLECCISRRLRRMAEVIALSAQLDCRGRPSLRTSACISFSEVDRLEHTYNNAMRQLTVADTFLPPMAFAPTQDPTSPRRHPTPRRVVDRDGDGLACVSLEAAVAAHASSCGNGTTRLPTPPRGRRSGHRFTVVYISVAMRTTAHSCSCPVTKRWKHTDSTMRHAVRRFREIHTTESHRHSYSSLQDGMNVFFPLLTHLALHFGGVLQEMNPDTCMVYFGAMPSVLTPSVVETSAVAAVRFALALQGQLVHARTASVIPPVSIIIDSTYFDCSSHYSEALDRKFFVASGRDVNDDIGYVLPLIGVKVGLTEETAVLVQHAVRVLPLEALYVGRAEHSEYTLVLYEALPGSVEEPAWQHFQTSFFHAFLSMTAGQYSEALALFDEAAAVEGLEAELLPPSMRTECQELRVGGTGDTLSELWTSSQLDRLTSVCAQRILTRDAERYVRHPLSEDFLRLLGAPLKLRSGHSPARMRHSAVTSDEEERHDPVAYAHHVHTTLFQVADPCAAPMYERFIAEVPGTNLRYTHACPDFLIDNHGTQWTLPQIPLKTINEPMVNRKYLGMSPTGALAVLHIVPYRTHATPSYLQGVPLGKVGAQQSLLLVPKTDDQLCVATHLFPTHFFQKSCTYVASVLGYSNSVEGGIVIVSAYCPGGNLRELIERYGCNTPHHTVIRIAMRALCGLACMHSHAMVHGDVRPENMMVGTDGICRLKGYFSDYALAHRNLMLPLSIYVSPEVADGAMPTAASDMYAFGLVLLEVLGQRPPWVWAHGVKASAEDLEELLQSAGTVPGHANFCAAIREGRLVTAQPTRGKGIEAAWSCAAECLRREPSRRITVLAALETYGPHFDLPEVLQSCE